MALFEMPNTSAMGDDTKYSRMVKIPHYEPSGVKPNLMSLCNTDKYVKLLNKINNSNVSEEEKKFLRLSATRHIVFNYSQIADYYANGDREMQELMEESALVIVDIDDAIANGYVKLSEKLKEIRKDGKKASEFT